MFEKSDVLPRDIKYKVDVQTSKLVKNDTEYNVYGTYGHSYSVHEESISQTGSVIYRCARLWRVVPLGQA